MKVFKFFIEENFYAYAAQTEEKARYYFNNEIGDDCDKCEEIPESEWDEKTLSIYPDNDFSQEPFKVSIREAICGTGPQFIYTNDLNML